MLKFRKTTKTGNVINHKVGFWDDRQGEFGQRCLYLSCFVDEAKAEDTRFQGGWFDSRRPAVIIKGGEGGGRKNSSTRGGEKISSSSDRAAFGAVDVVNTRLGDTE